jgi:hypothetical protein
MNASRQWLDSSAHRQWGDASKPWPNRSRRPNPSPPPSRKQPPSRHPPQPKPRIRKNPKSRNRRRRPHRTRRKPKRPSPSATRAQGESTMNLATPTIASDDSRLRARVGPRRHQRGTGLRHSCCSPSRASVFVLAALFVGRLIRPQLDHPEKQRGVRVRRAGGRRQLGPVRPAFLHRRLVLHHLRRGNRPALAVGGGLSRELSRRIGRGLGTLLPLYAMLFFLLPIVVGFAYEWRCGYLDWVRASTGQRSPRMAPADQAAEDRRRRLTGDWHDDSPFSTDCS